MSYSVSWRATVDFRDINDLRSSLTYYGPLCISCDHGLGGLAHSPAFDANWCMVLSRRLTCRFKSYTESADTRDIVIIGAHSVPAICLLYRIMVLRCCRGLPCRRSRMLSGRPSISCDARCVADWVATCPICSPDLMCCGFGCTHPKWGSGFIWCTAVLFLPPFSFSSLLPATSQRNVI